MKNLSIICKVLVIFFVLTAQAGITDEMRDKTGNVKPTTPIESMSDDPDQVNLEGSAAQFADTPEEAAPEQVKEKPTTAEKEKSTTAAKKKPRTTRRPRGTARKARPTSSKAAAATSAKTKKPGTKGASEESAGLEETGARKSGAAGRAGGLGLSLGLGLSGETSGLSGDLSGAIGAEAGSLGDVGGLGAAAGAGGLGDMGGLGADTSGLGGAAETGAGGLGGLGGGTGGLGETSGLSDPSSVAGAISDPSAGAGTGAATDTTGAATDTSGFGDTSGLGGMGSMGGMDPYGMGGMGGMGMGMGGVMPGGGSWSAQGKFLGEKAEAMDQKKTKTITDAQKAESKKIDSFIRGLLPRATAYDIIDKLRKTKAPPEQLPPLDKDGHPAGDMSVTCTDEPKQLENINTPPDVTSFDTNYLKLGKIGLLQENHDPFRDDLLLEPPRRINVTTDLSGLGKKGRATVTDGNIDVALDVITDAFLSNFKNREVSVKSVDFSKTFVQDESQLAASLGLNTSIGAAGLNLSSDISAVKRGKSSMMVAVYKNVAYTAKIDPPPTRPSDFFGYRTTVKKLQKVGMSKTAVPVYFSRIIMGTKLFVVMKSNEAYDEIKMSAAMESALSGSAAKSSVESTNLKKNFSFEIHQLGGDQSASAGVAANPETLNLQIAKLAKFTYSNRPVPIAGYIRTLTGQEVGLKLVGPYTERTCKPAICKDGQQFCSCASVQPGETEVGAPSSSKSDCASTCGGWLHTQPYSFGTCSGGKKIIWEFTP